MGALRLRGSRGSIGAVGGIGSALARIAKVGGRLAGVTPIGRAIGLAASAATIGTGIAALGGPRIMPGGTVVQPSRFLPGGRPLFASAGGAPRGFHLAKDPQAAGRHGPQWPYVRNRRMNPSNGRAAKRAIRRIAAAEKMLRQIFQVSHKGPTPRILPKKKR